MELMELKIYNPSSDGFLEKIEWNYEELKAQIQRGSEEYASSVYTDDMIKAAKTDRAKLRKFADALTSKRTEIRKQLLKPDEQFGEEIKELVGIVQRAIDSIDSQIKGYEERQKEEKLAKIREFYDGNINDLEKYLPFERVMRPEYLNASKTMKSIKDEVTDLIQRVSEGLAILNEVDSKFAGDMKEVFLQTYDLGAAMATRNRLEAEEEKRRLYAEEQERKRAERAAKAQAEAGQVIAAGQAAIHPAATPAPVQAAQEPVPPVSSQAPEEPVCVLDFRVYVTKSQMLQLRDFMKNNGIRFERLKED